MKPQVTHELFEYWNRLRGIHAAPARDSIDPGAIRSCLPDTFLLSIDAGAGHPFRIAGTGICAMFGRELTGTPFLRLWEEDRRAVEDLVEQATAGPERAALIGRNGEDEAVELEIILLPLGCVDHGPRRLLGALTAVTEPYWLGTRALTSLHLGSRVPSLAGQFHQNITANPPLTSLE